MQLGYDGSGRCICCLVGGLGVIRLLRVGFRSVGGFVGKFGF